MDNEQHALLAQAAQDWDNAERAYEEERARYVAAAWGEPPEWGGLRPEVLDKDALDRLRHVGAEAAEAATVYDAMIQMVIDHEV